MNASFLTSSVAFSKSTTSWSLWADNKHGWQIHCWQFSSRQKNAKATSFSQLEQTAKWIGFRLVDPSAPSRGRSAFRWKAVGSFEGSLSWISALQTGHVHGSICFLHASNHPQMHFRQKLWRHGSVLGSFRISLQTGQDNSRANSLVTFTSAMLIYRFQKLMKVLSRKSCHACSFLFMGLICISIRQNNIFCLTCSAACHFSI